MVLLPNVSHRSVTAANCSDNPDDAAPVKLQILVFGDRTDEVTWIFDIDPNPFTGSGKLEVTDNDDPT